MTELLSTQKEQRESLKREGATLREAKGSESWVQFLRHDHLHNPRTSSIDSLD